MDSDNPAITLILGAVQGVTEFLPISSDGHLALASALLGFHETSLAFVVLLHAGTLLATLLVLAPEVALLLAAVRSGLLAPRDLAASTPGKELLAVFVASVPTAAIGLLLSEHVEQWSASLPIVGACLLASAVFVGSTARTDDGKAEVLDWKRAALVGVVQGLAVLPGLSRSASTIALGMALGLSGPAAFRFSFLLSLPAVAGACLLELLRPGALAGLGAPAVLGAVCAFATGYVALRLLRGVVSRGQLWVFAVYLVPVGCLALVWPLL